MNKTMKTLLVICFMFVQLAVLIVLCLRGAWSLALAMFAMWVLVFVCTGVDDEDKTDKD